MGNITRKLSPWKRDPISNAPELGVDYYTCRSCVRCNKETFICPSCDEPVVIGYCVFYREHLDPDALVEEKYEEICEGWYE